MVNDFSNVIFCIFKWFIQNTVFNSPFFHCVLAYRIKSPNIFNLNRIEQPIFLIQPLFLLNNQPSDS